jgi:uncharacterized protein
MIHKIQFLRKIILLLVFTSNIIVSFSQYTGSVKVILRKTNPITAVNDFGLVFSPSQVSYLEQKLKRFYDSTSTEIVIVTVPSLNDYPIDDVSYAYAKTWQVGNKQRDNGVIILLAKNERKIRIETGRGLDGAMPDGMAGTIIRRDILPYFKQEQYYEGIDNGTNSVMKATQGEYKMDIPNDRRDGNSEGGSGMSLMIMLLVLFLIILFIVKRKGGGGNNGGMLTRRGYRRWGQPSVFDYGPWGGAAGGGIFGSGGGSSSGGGGDFGGFGGGDFGGGGASGDW